LLLAAQSNNLILDKLAFGAQLAQERLGIALNVIAKLGGVSKRQ